LQNDRLSLTEQIGRSLAVLQDRLAMTDLLTETQPRKDPAAFYQLVMRKGRVELRMYQEPNHRRPHFHLKFKEEHSASYAIDDFSRLAGDMPLKYERDILNWAKENQRDLLQQWQSLNEEEVFACEMDDT
jgi:hypothetical protein